MTSPLPLLPRAIQTFRATESLTSFTLLSQVSPLTPPGYLLDA
jgi:hypothetical protein